MPGLPELLIVLVVILLVFGPKRLPSLGRQLGGGMREFKDSLTRKADEDDAADEEAEAGAAAPARPELTRAQQADVLDPLPDATKAPTGARDESATRPGS
ncbi:MAG: twin-arginine translocase TatA/TatE family subunit [Conexibacter sp.]|jgi:sec-independent protein translocase protein TatA|nr:twin-arginine translocase TatA/TatE family subunit [Conexibacter sp.]MCZ4492474.1 twin-arginine translocase TatA/TatE family subunit [Conexibacter sp.]